MAGLLLLQLKRGINTLLRSMVRLFVCCGKKALNDSLTYQVHGKLLHTDCWEVRCTSVDDDDDDCNIASRCTCEQDAQVRRRRRSLNNLLAVVGVCWVWRLLVRVGADFHAEHFLFRQQPFCPGSLYIRGKRTDQCTHNHFDY